MNLDFLKAKDKPIINNFVHLHLHTIYSTLDGVCKLPSLMERAKELNMKAIAITDHGHTGGCLAFQRACKEANIKPILGAELYMTENMNIASKDVDWRAAYALAKMFNNESIANICWDIEERKRDYKSAEEYLKMLTQSNDKYTADNILEVFGKKRINNFKKNNKKIFEKYEYDMHQYHLIVLAKNNIGWKNLITIQSLAANDCTYNGRFLCDLDLLSKYHEGLIVTTACVGSLFSKLIQRKQENLAEELILKFKEVFQDDFYLELQPLTIPQQVITNAFYLKMHNKYNIQVVATSDVHYIDKDDWDDHDTYMCIATGRYKDETKDREVYSTKKGYTPRMKYTNDFWFRSKEEMVEAFLNQEICSNDTFRQEENPLDTEEYRKLWLTAINNTVKIADKIGENILIGSKETLYPHVNNVPAGFTHDEWLYAEAIDGLIKYKKKMEDAGTPIDFERYKNKIIDEMAVITSKGYTDYFLGVQEYVNWANSINPETNMPYAVTGPGRGSAGASLVLFLIGITKNIDPIKYNLMFSRFLTMDRTESPDIDIDFSYRHRPLVIKHLEEVYGKDHVCHIGTWGQESIYTAIKDFARVLAYPVSVADTINKQLQTICGNNPNASFKLFDSLKEEEPSNYEAFKKIEEANTEIFRLARKFEGSIRQMGTHASGIIACPESLIGLVPTRKDPKTGDTVALFTGTELESVGIIKFDILGLRTLDCIEDTLTSIGKDFEWLYNKVSMNDKKAFKMICNGQSEGMFQIESNMMKGLIKSIQPDNIEDLSALVAIGRPGPLSVGTDKQYAEWKKDKTKIQEFLPGISDILERSYGTIIYQEQLMAISVRVCGFNQGQSDSIVRKILGKKKAAMLPMLRRCMIYGKKNCDGPAGWENDDNAPWYDPKEKYGAEICGAVANGYTVEAIDKFFHDIQGFASYCFNLAHSLAYGYVGLLTAYLKSHYPAQYMAALLSMQTEDEKKEAYMKICEDMGIHIATPNINKSGLGFTAIDDKTITYGLASIKGVKEISEIIEKAPFLSLQDAYNKLSSKTFKKNVAENLIKAGAFDFENTNRNILLNKLYDLRNKKEEHIDETFTREDCMNYESKTLGTTITYQPKWKGALAGEPLSGNCTLDKIKHHITKTKKQEMAMLTVINETYKQEALVFPKQYSKLKKILDEYEAKQYVFIKGKMDKEGKKLIIDIIEPAKSEDIPVDPMKTTTNAPVFDLNPYDF